MSHRGQPITFGLAIVVIALAPLAFVGFAFPDAKAPDGLSGSIGEFDRVVASQVGRRLSQARFTTIEHGPDQFVVLYFELRMYPFIGPPERA